MIVHGLEDPAQVVSLVLLLWGGSTTKPCGFNLRKPDIHIYIHLIYYLERRVRSLRVNMKFSKLIFRTIKNISISSPTKPIRERNIFTDFHPPVAKQKKSL